MKSSDSGCLEEICGQIPQPDARTRPLPCRARRQASPASGRGKARAGPARSARRRSRAREPGPSMPGRGQQDSYVFNDPINATDPSGFLGISPGYPAGAVITGGWGDVGGFGVSAGINIATTLINGLPQSVPSGTYAVAPASQAPTTATATRSTQHAVGQNRGGVGSATPMPLDVPDASMPDGLGACDSGECIASRGRRPPRGAPAPGGQPPPVLRPQRGNQPPRPLPGRPSGPPRGFNSHQDLVNHLGPAGPNMVWHHIVLQTPANVLRFGPQTIHNTSNVARITVQQHYQIHSFLETPNQAITGSRTMRVREWIQRMPFEQQQTWGNAILKAVTGIR
jgi:hypothetical protein